MKQYGFYFDAARCTGCKACQIACADKNGLEDGRVFRNVLPYESGSWREDRATGAWHQDVFHGYVSVSCNHCDDPACDQIRLLLSSQRLASMISRNSIDRNKCIGCGMCAAACPYHAPVLDKKAGKMTKCDACVDRISKGGLPVCVEACTQRALDFGYVDELRKKYGEGAHIVPLPSPSKTKPNLVIHPAAKAQIVE